MHRGSNGHETGIVVPLAAKIAPMPRRFEFRAPKLAILSRAYGSSSFDVNNVRILSRALASDIELGWVEAISLPSGIRYWVAALQRQQFLQLAPLRTAGGALAFRDWEWQNSAYRPGICIRERVACDDDLDPADPSRNAFPLRPPLLAVRHRNAAPVPRSRGRVALSASLH